MIILDTHIWVWWVNGDGRLSAVHHQHIKDNEQHGLGVSVISCWEIAKKVEVGKLTLLRPVEEWMAYALTYRGILWLPLTPEIALESTQLPGPFHRDPADQMIVATARIHNRPLLTDDANILAYPHVKLLK